MLIVLLGNLYDNIMHLKNHECFLLIAMEKTPHNHNSRLCQNDLELMHHDLSRILINFESTGLVASSRLLKQIIEGLPTITLVRLQENFKQLNKIIEEDLNDHLFLYVPSDKAGYYNRKDAFGIDVSKKFCSASQDIKDACNCFAFGQYTACIFHLMRIAEYGLRALAKERKVAIKNKPIEWAEWGTIIKEIDKKIVPMESAHAGPEKDAALSFYHGILGELRGFKNVYRNPTMHPRKMYEEYEAMAALHHVSEFMKRLSTHITERTRKSINWKLKYGP